MEWEIASDIALRLQDLRKAMDWTQKAFGRKVGRGYRQVLSWEKGTVAPPRRVLEALAEDHGWPVDIFAEGGPMPSTVVNRPLTERSGAGPSPISAGEIEELQRDPDYEPEGSGLNLGLGTDLTAEDVIHMLLYNRAAFTRYLQTQFDTPTPLPVAAKLGFLDHVERIARDHGVPIPRDFLDQTRAYIRIGGL